MRTQMHNLAKMVDSNRRYHAALINLTSHDRRICGIWAHIRGGSRVLGKGGPINIFLIKLNDSKGPGGALIAPPVGFGAKPQPLFAFAFI